MPLQSCRYSVCGTSRDQRGRGCCCRCSRPDGVGGNEDKQRWVESSLGGKVVDEVEDDAAMREKCFDEHHQEGCEKE